METHDSNRFINKRFNTLQKAKDSQLFGIIISSLGKGTNLLDKVRYLLKAHGKEYYVITVGKLTPAKLANYPDIDMFVHCACEFNCIIPNAEDFMAPIITPIELNYALSNIWHGRLELGMQDFEVNLEGMLSEGR